ncbi:MAG: SDR family oxidoreductase [Chloroflexi bacterium]|nr:MAG: SDR family oxidoreductase [Chloroflexota bacterium]
MDLQLEGKVAVITGGSSGIGLAVAEKFAQERVNVLLCARDGALTMQQAERISNTYNVAAVGMRADVTQVDDIAQVVKRTEDEFGGVDILFNNAGVGTKETIMDAPDSDWQYYWDLHVMAAVRLSRALVPMMRRRGGGVIVNNASICALQPLYHEPIYNVTKAALVMLTKCMAHEFIGDNIRVNNVNPGLIQTSGWEVAAKERTANSDMTWQAYLKNYAEEKTPIGRFATPDELSDFIVFLCSPRASYCVGSSYYVDGGWLNVTT